MGIAGSCRAWVQGGSFWLVALCCVPVQAEEQRPDGYRVRSFFIQPQVTVATGFDSNPRGARDGDGTLFVRLAPELVVRSGWSRHALRLTLGAEGGVHLGSPEDNYLDAGGELAGEIDVTRRISLQLAVAARRAHEPRNSGDLPKGAAEPSLFTEVSVEAGGELRLSRLRIGPYVAVRWLDFDDLALIGGGEQDQDHRDRREAEAGIEIAWKAGPGWQPFLHAGLFDIDYSSGSGDQHGMVGLFGVRLRLSEIFSGRIALGASYRDFDDPAASDLTSFQGEASLLWRPTRRLSVEFEAGRDWLETAIPGATGRISDRAGMTLGYDLTRRWNLVADTRFLHDGYRGLERTDMGFEIGLGAEWTPIRGLALSPAYRFERRLSTANGQGYVAHSLSIIATFRPGAQK